MSKSLNYQVVEGARVLVEAPSRWTRHYLALNRKNRVCDPTDPRAVRFCAYGALMKSAHDLAGNDPGFAALVGSVAMSITGQDSTQDAFDAIYTVNDGPEEGSRQAILDLFDKALERL